MIRYIIFLFSLAIMVSCAKGPGSGGNSTIRGKVWVKDYNGSFTLLLGSYYAPEEDVYIIYGDEATYSERVKTNYDGTFEFRYLRPGNYKIYAYSKDSTLQTTSMKAVIQDVSIGSKKEVVITKDLVILK